LFVSSIDHFQQYGADYSFQKYLATPPSFNSDSDNKLVSQYNDKEIDKLFKNEKQDLMRLTLVPTLAPQENCCYVS
jgi:hypothetical protein